MGLESNVDFLVDLNRLWPLSTDQKRYGDDHVRNLKKALQQSFGGFAAGIWVTGTDGGAANAYTVNPAVLPPSLGAKMTVVFAPVATNTGACTLNYAGLGVKALKSVSGADLVAGDLVLGSIYAAFYNGTEYRLLSITKNYADQLAFSTALPAQAGNSGKYLTTDGISASWVAVQKIPTIVVFSASGTWTCPANVTLAKVTVIGGGGSSGANGGNVASGGAGGGTAIKHMTVTPGTVYTVTVGAGGTAVAVAGSGNTGGTSSFSGAGITTVSATGGSGGSSASNSGAGGIGSNGDINMQGGTSAAITINSNGLGTKGGSTFLAAGGPAGIQGLRYGEGAGGVYSTTTGLAGADGVVIVEY